MVAFNRVILEGSGTLLSETMRCMGGQELLFLCVSQIVCSPFNGRVCPVVYRVVARRDNGASAFLSWCFLALFPRAVKAGDVWRRAKEASTF